MNKIKVLAFPKYKNRKSNPYNSLLYSGFDKMDDIYVDEFSLYKLFIKKYDVVHIHWPESYLNSKYFIKAFLCSFMLLIGLVIKKLKGAKVLWTIHNLSPHEVKYKTTNHLFWRVYLKLVDGAISLSKENEKIARRDIDNYSKFTLSRVVYHGLYCDVYENNTTQALSREFLNLSKQDKVVLILGQMKRYKNIETLVDVFNGIKDESYKLLIVGRFEDSDYLNDVKLKIKNNNIYIIDKFIKDEEIKYYYNACDISVIPFKKIFNSGSMLLSVGFNRKVLVPETPAFLEYKNIMGEEAISTFSGDLDKEDIFRCMECEGTVDFDVEMFSWPYIRRETLEVYKELLC